MVDSTKPTLGYWKIRGLAAPIRYVLNYLKVDFNDVMYEQGDAPDFNIECWTSVKFTLGLEFANLPYFIDGDVKITESSVSIH
jgi:glutathione S-transferase